jgi:Flp pilus assembly pilin Flp
MISPQPYNDSNSDELRLVAHTIHLMQTWRFLMRNVFAQLINDEAGFIVSAELVLVATIGVLALIVGLTEVAFNVNNELEDVGSAIGSINQTYQYNGTSGTKGQVAGSVFWDNSDAGDSANDIVCSVAPTGEDTSWQN